MSASREVVSVNDVLADQSAVYLAMWSALEVFDPNADRWAEPFEFGPPARRIEIAEAAIARAKQSLNNNLDKDLERDIRLFHKHVRTLSQGSKFSQAMKSFSSELRQKGSKLADESVRLVKVKEPAGNR